MIQKHLFQIQRPASNQGATPYGLDQKDDVFGAKDLLGQSFRKFSTPRCRMRASEDRSKSLFPLRVLG